MIAYLREPTLMPCLSYESNLPGSNYTLNTTSKCQLEASVSAVR